MTKAARILLQGEGESPVKSLEANKVPTLIAMCSNGLRYAVS